MNLRCLLLIFVVFTTVACAKYTSVRHSENYQSAIARSNHEALYLPPEIEVNTIYFANKKKRMYDYELYLENIVQQEVVSAMQELGFRVQVIRRRDLYQQNLRKESVRIRDNYNLNYSELYKKDILKEEFAFNINNNIGRESSVIGHETQADLILMIDYARAVKSSGTRTSDFLSDVILKTNRLSDVDRSTLVIGIIEAKTGKIIWINKISRTRDWLGSSIDNFTTEDKLVTEKVKSLISIALQPLKQDIQNP